MSAVLDQAKTTSLAELRAPAAPPETRMPIVRAGFGDLQGFELAQRAAKALAASTLVPQQFQGNMPNCLIALEMAQRIGASPLMVMQNLYIVHGRPAWSAKFLIASFNQCGRFSALRFEWSGTRGKDDWGCRAWALERETQQRIQGPLITIDLAKREKWYEKTGSKWQTIPELMLQYRAAAWLVNTHAPEISMGLNTAEELGDVYDAAPGSDGRFVVESAEDLKAPDPKPETGSVEGKAPEAGAAPSFESLMKLIERARDTTDKEVALLQLEDVEASLSALSGDELKSAKKALEATKKEVKERKA